MTDLNRHSVVITGAGQGLGAAYARAAAALGARIVVNDRDSALAEAVAAEIRASDGQVIADHHDVRDFNSAEALVERCIAEFGAITGLVNNAAILFHEMFEVGSVEHLRAMLEVNVVGVFNCARAAIGPMLAQGSGSIVNITSGAQTGQPTLSSYGATKGAVASFTYGWADELRGRGVRVNAVSPMGATRMSDYDPLLPPPDMNAPAVLYLLSDRSRDVTGQIVRIVGRKLSLMCHPANRAPILERDAWSLDSVAEAFETTLAANQLPTNVATYEISAVIQ